MPIIVINCECVYTIVIVINMYVPDDSLIGKCTILNYKFHSIDLFQREMGI